VNPELRAIHFPPEIPAMHSDAGHARSDITPTVFILNLLVTGAIFANYHRSGYFFGRRRMRMVFTSPPAAYLDGALVLSQPALSGILGGTLFIAGRRFVLFTKPNRPHPPLGSQGVHGNEVPGGLFLGWLAGLIGISGEVLLRSLLRLTGWGNAKEMAPISAAFIFLKSVSGSAPHTPHGTCHPGRAFSIGIRALIGARIGSRPGARKVLAFVFHHLLGIVLQVASSKMIRDLILRCDGLIHRGGFRIISPWTCRMPGPMRRPSCCTFSSSFPGSRTTWATDTGPPPRSHGSRTQRCRY